MNPPFPPASSLVAYLRDSGGDDQDLSIDQQQTAIRAWCADRGYTLTRVFTDTRSGTSTVGRTGFEAMLRYLFQKKRVPEAGIILWRYNRFARDLDDAQFFKAGLRRRGYTIHSIQDPIPEGPAGRVLEFFIDWMADKFSEDLSVEVKRGQRHLLEQHGALGGFPPKGFIRQPVQLGARRDGQPHIVHRWVPDPDLWETCRLAWRMRAAGASYREIHAKTRLFSSVNSYVTFYRNRLYLGELQFRDLVITNYVEPLIDQATWDAVQAINARHARNTGAGNPIHARRLSSSFLLSGLVRCGQCGALLNGDTVRPSNERYTRAYYSCSRSRTQWDCPTRRIPQAAIEQAVIDRLTGEILQPDYLHILLEEQRIERQDQATSASARRDELRRQLQAVRLRITNTAAAIAETGHSRALVSLLQQLEAQETQLLSDLSELETWLLQSPVSYSPERLQRFCANLRFILTRADPASKRKILRGLIQTITVQRQGKQIHGIITLYTPTDTLLTTLSDLPPLDDITFDTPDPPHELYAIALIPPGGTTHTHTIPFSAEIKRRS